MSHAWAWTEWLCPMDSDDTTSTQVRTEVPVDGQTVSKYSFVICTVDSAAARKSLFYH